jgi:drug/metabolite transporter (DMT)-like permease
MAPSMAIQQIYSIFSIFLGVVFLGQGVTMSQLLAAVGIIIGCAFLKLYH